MKRTWSNQAFSRFLMGSIDPLLKRCDPSANTGATAALTFANAPGAQCFAFIASSPIAGLMPHMNARTVHL